MSTILEKHKKRMLFNFLSKKYNFTRVTVMEMGDDIVFTFVYNDSVRIIRLGDGRYDFMGVDKKTNNPYPFTKTSKGKDSEEIELSFTSNMEFLMEDATKFTSVVAFTHISPMVVDSILYRIGSIGNDSHKVEEINNRERYIRCTVNKSEFNIDRFTVLEDEGSLIFLYHYISPNGGIEKDEEIISMAVASLVDYVMEEE